MGRLHPALPLALTAVVLFALTQSFPLIGIELEWAGSVDQDWIGRRRTIRARPFAPGRLGVGRFRRRTAFSHFGQFEIRPRTDQDCVVGLRAQASIRRRHAPGLTPTTRVKIRVK